MEYYSATHNKRNHIGENMDGPWEYYAKQNKSDRDRQICIISLNNVESKKTKQIIF